MWLPRSVYEEYRKVVSQDFGAAPGADVFITLEDLQKHLALNDKDFEGMISDIKPSILYRVRLAKAPAAYRESRRYNLFGEEWVFFAMEKIKGGGD